MCVCVCVCVCATVVAAVVVVPHTGPNLSKSTDPVPLSLSYEQYIEKDRKQEQVLRVPANAPFVVAFRIGGTTEYGTRSS